jgi:hypothetical protein
MATTFVVGRPSLRVAAFKIVLKNRCLIWLGRRSVWLLLGAQIQVFMRCAKWCTLIQKQSAH